MPTSFARQVRAAAPAALVAPLACLALHTAHAQSNEKLLRDSAVTEANLLEALTPSASTGTGDAGVQVRSRSLKVSPTSPSAAQALVPKKRPNASLLVTFETNSAALTAHAKEMLNVVATTLGNDKLKNFTFTIVGHADARGNPEANLTLSQRRAEAVRQYLVDAGDVPANKLRAIGKGDKEPLNTSDIAAAENRRVAFVTNVP